MGDLMSTIMELQGVTYENQGEVIIDKLSLSIKQNDFIVVNGPSGGGKSTLFKLCAHLIEPTNGTIFFHEKPASAYDPVEFRKRVSYCFQSPVLFGKSIEENLAFPFEIRNLPYDPLRVQELFELFEINQAIIKTNLTNLSGGEKQRLALLRNLIFVPDILLLDEITSALDQENTVIVEKAIQKFYHDGLTILWITHSPDQRLRLSDKRITIAEGKICAKEGML